MKLTDAVDYTVTEGVAVITIDNPPVNAINAAVSQGLHAAMQRANADADAQGVLIICDGRTFVAGADIRGFSKSKKKGLSAIETEKQYDECPKPIVAAVHGTAFGGGFELAMRAHYIMAAPGSRFALPEVTLGILAGAGGTQKLPRMIGVEPALDLMISGEPMGLEDAMKYGLVDRAATSIKGLRGEALTWLRELIDSGAPLKRIQNRNEKLAEARDNPGFFDAYRKKVAKKIRGFEAPAAIIRCVEACVNESYEEGRRIEVEEFLKLRAGPQRPALSHLFFAERAARKVADLPKDIRPLPVQKVGIIGAGTMGGGIAMSFANAGKDVVLVESRQENLDRGLATIKRNYQRSVKSGRFTPTDVEERLSRLSGTLDRERLHNCDLIIEAVFENMDLKKEIFRDLDRIARHGAILATNTSGLDINEIAAVTGRPEAVIGLHFFSPANVMKLVEVVRGDATGAEALSTALQVLPKIGKVPVVVGVCPGFVGNRILYARTWQTNELLHAGTSPVAIDKAMVDFGFPMGPLQARDLAGMDIGWNKATSRGETLKDVMCEKGRLGQKNGLGFYRYDPETRRAEPDPGVEEIIAAFNKEKGHKQRSTGPEEIVERHLYAMINEAALILEEGIAARPSDIDVIYTNGYGWPKYTGGPMFWADRQGLPAIVSRLEEFLAADGNSRWRPAPLLTRLAREGKTFADLNQS